MRPLERPQTRSSGVFFANNGFRHRTVVRHYKPDREVYQSAADFLDLKPAEVMMVAAHRGDLRAAKDIGLRTAFVARPLEFGPEGRPDLTADLTVDVAAKDFIDLADQLQT